VRSCFHRPVRERSSHGGAYPWIRNELSYERLARAVDRAEHLREISMSAHDRVWDRRAVGVFRQEAYLPAICVSSRKVQNMSEISLIHYKDQIEAFEVGNSKLASAEVTDTLASPEH
jgi:hypothetical protein